MSNKITFCIENIPDDVYKRMSNSIKKRSKQHLDIDYELSDIEVIDGSVACDFALDDFAKAIGILMGIKMLEISDQKKQHNEQENNNNY